MDGHEQGPGKPTSPEETYDLVKRSLKVLLLYLAQRSETPSEDLQEVLHEVITELHAEVREAIQAKSNHLRLVSTESPQN